MMLNNKIEHVIIFGIINSILFSIRSYISQYCYFVKQIHAKVIYLFTLILFYSKLLFLMT